jgi:hypothetical protein
MTAEIIMFKDYRKRKTATADALAAELREEALLPGRPLVLPHGFVAKEARVAHDLGAFFKAADQDTPFAFTSPRRRSYTMERLDRFTDEELNELKDFLFGPGERPCPSK